MAQHFFDLGIVSDINAEIAGLPLYTGGFDKDSFSMGRFKKTEAGHGLIIPPITYEGVSAGFFTNDSFTNADVLIKTKLVAKEELNNFFNTGPGIFFRADPSTGNKGYQLAWGMGTHTRSLRFYNSIDTSVNIGASSTSYLPSKTPLQLVKQSLFIRANFSGTSLKARAWFDDVSEPSTWGIEITNSAYTSGKIGILIQKTDDGRIYDFLSIGTDGDLAPSSYPGGGSIVQGTLTRPNGAPAGGYIVRCYHRATGCILGEVLSEPSGDFLFSVNTKDEVYCLGVDQLGNVWNAAIKDMIDPV